MTESPELGRPPTSLEDWLKRVKSVWVVLLLPLAVWSASLYIGFIGTSPPDDAGNPEDLTLIARIIIAACFVLWGSFALGFSRRHHLWFWRIILISMLVLTIFGWGTYRWARKGWICEVNHAYVIGSPATYSEFARTYIAEAHKDGRTDTIGCQELIEASVGHPNNIWAQSEIDRHRFILTTLFLTLIPFFVLTLSSASQILILHKLPDPSSFFSGEWQDSWTPSKIPDIRITLTVIDRTPSGRISFNFLTDTWKEKDITPENARFRGNRLHINLEQPFPCVMKVDADGRTAHLYGYKSELKSWTLTKGL